MMLWSLFVVGVLMTVTDADCPDGWSEYESACYIYFMDHDNWNDARTHCHSFDFSCNDKYARLSLATLTNDGERKFANSLWKDATGGRITDTYRARYWIGLYKNNEGWHWDDARKVVADELNWAKGEPNNQGGHQNCAAVWFDDLTWDDRNCYTPEGLAYLCEFKCE
ncbi:ladderlectin-like [Anneissia japonica]|uniref:ladderlectin-like n=1 Tax=Anneissia japonica TaxID=1529436 RepID=UPI001425AB29|nr:ladderlectin-like [Anneissia japonica]